jgi:hypothetical protein
MKMKWDCLPTEHSQLKMIHPYMGRKSSIDKLTVPLCTNMDGSNKMKPFIIRNQDDFVASRAIKPFHVHTNPKGEHG